MGRMPLRTRGRDDGVADSGIMLIDSVMKLGECSRLSKNAEMAHSIVAGEGLRRSACYKPYAVFAGGNWMRR